jgi:uncharacterized iron-regulated protein
MQIPALILCAMILAGCAAGPGPLESWESEVQRGNWLAGRIWQPGEKRYATARDVVAALGKADFVLLGEKHDNPDHHRVQAWLLRQMIESGRRPAVAFEMLTESQQAALDAHLAASPGDAAGLGEALGWKESGWPDWAMYQPIAEAALSASAPLLAAGPDREATRAVARGGMDALGAERVRALRLNEPPSDSMRAKMRKVVDESHCFQLPEGMLDAMVDVTLAKDAVMADWMIRGAAVAGRDSAVLITGTGHTRADTAVPWHLRRLAADREIVTVAIVEVVAGETRPAVYGEIYGGALPFDFVWFTPRVDDDDPCQIYADQLRKARERAKPPPAGEQP